MSDTATVTTAQLVEMIYDDLAQFAAENGGRCYLTKNPFDLIKYLEEEPGAWRVTLHWEGDRNPDSRVQGGRVTRNSFRLIVDGKLGMSASPAIALIKETASRSPFLALLDLLRSRILSYQFPWLREPNNRAWYVATDDKLPLPDGLFIAAYNMEFYVYSVRAEPQSTIELQLPADPSPEEPPDESEE